HAAMPNGTGLAGNPAGNQTVATAKVPGSTSQYYVFTSNADGTTGGTISYSIVDMALSGNATFPAPALGDVSSKNTPLGVANRSEAMIIIMHENRRDFWLLTHDNGAPNYSITLFDNSGTGPVSTTNVTLGLIDV